MNIFFDSYNRSDAAAGTSDSGHAYAASSSSVIAVVSSKGLTNTSAVSDGDAWTDIGLREFDATITLKTIVGKALTIAGAGSASLIKGLAVYVSGSSSGVLADGYITLFDIADAASSLGSSTGLVIGNAGTIRIILTKNNVKIYNGTTKVIDFDTVLYPNYTDFAFSFPTTSTAATVESVTLKALAARSTTRTTLITEIRDLLGEPNEDDSNVSAATMLRFIGRVLTDVTAKIPFIRRSYQVSGVGDSNGLHGMPEDFNRILYVGNGDTKIYEKHEWPLA